MQGSLRVYRSHTPPKLFSHPYYPSLQPPGVLLIARLGLLGLPPAKSPGVRIITPVHLLPHPVSACPFPLVTFPPILQLPPFLQESTQ